MGQVAAKELLERYDSNALIAWLDKVSLDVLGWKLPTYISMYNESVSHYPLLAITAAAYLAVIFSLSHIVKYYNLDFRKSRIFNGYALVHNVFMSALSVYMFIDCVLNVYVDGGWSSYDTYFSLGGRYPGVCNLFYWSKYLELIDTVILVLKGKKELGFLHLFHHCTTASCSYVTRYQPLWIGVWTNSLIHVFMYAHFARPVAFIRSTITTAQIIQFLFVIACYNIWWLAYSSGVHVKDVLYGNMCYSVYLYFFVLFFIDNYIRPKKPSSGALKKEQ